MSLGSDALTGRATSPGRSAVSGTRTSPGAPFIGLSKLVAVILAFALLSCGERPVGEVGGDKAARPDLPKGLLVAMAALDEDFEGKVLPLPAQLGILEFEGGEWVYRSLDDPDSNVFHKAMEYDGRGVLTLGGTGASVKLWLPGSEAEVLWQEDFGGRFSRMRDAEVADLFGDGRQSIAIATHDQGVVAVLHPDDEGGYEVERLDEEPDTFVHEIEIGDVDGDGVLEVYATPSAPNKLDGTPQPGKVVRYVPALEEGRVVVADLGDRHAKEILVADVDGDGRDELYVSVEAVSGGKVEIRRYDSDTPPTGGQVIAELDDKLCRFLTVGDIDGDGRQEMVAAGNKSGLWLLRHEAGTWSMESLDVESSGFEHAAVFADLDEDGRDELYVASDKHDEIRSYIWHGQEFEREVIYQHSDGLSRFTWNLMPVERELLPGSK